VFVSDRLGCSAVAAKPSHLRHGGLVAPFVGIKNHRSPDKCSSSGIGEIDVYQKTYRRISKFFYCYTHVTALLCGIYPLIGMDYGPAVF